ncbi:MAG: MerR family transcriptional regulator [Gemmatimonadales bacterium]
MTEQLRIGDVAARSGVTRDTIRFYERSGLLDTPARTSNRHRVYGSDALERVRFVRQLQNCGLTINDIKELFFLRDLDSPVVSKRVMEVLRRRLIFLEERIANYERCRARLIDVMRDVAAARSRGYAALGELPHDLASPPYQFGRRSSKP